MFRTFLARVDVKVKLLKQRLVLQSTQSSRCSLRAATAAGPSCYVSATLPNSHKRVRASEAAAAAVAKPASGVGWRRENYGTSKKCRDPLNRVSCSLALDDREMSPSINRHCGGVDELEAAEAEPLRSLRRHFSQLSSEVQSCIINMNSWATLTLSDRRWGGGA